MDVRLGRSGRVYRGRRDGDGSVVVHLDAEGDGLALHLEPRARGSWTVEGPDGRRTGHAVRDGQVVWVRWGGRTWRFDIVHGRRSTRSDEGGLTAPMPGQILRHLVGEGDLVEAGQALLVMEAMKMQLEIKAPRPGRVKRFLAAEGVQVPGDAPLVELEETP